MRTPRFQEMHLRISQTVISSLPCYTYIIHTSLSEEEVKMNFYISHEEFIPEKLQFILFPKWFDKLMIT